MILAAIGAIRGNVKALRKTLEILDDEGIQTLVNTGDSVVGGAHPGEVIDTLVKRQIPSVQGGSDKQAVRYFRKRKSLQKRVSPEHFEALAKAYEALKSSHLEYLIGLPTKLSLTLDGVPIALCHGSLAGHTDVLEKDTDETLFQRQREINPAAIILSGGAAEAFSREVDGTLFVSPGVIGAPSGQATYAVISTEEEPWSVDLRSLDYE